MEIKKKRNGLPTAFKTPFLQNQLISRFIDLLGTPTRTYLFQETNTLTTAERISCFVIQIVFISKTVRVVNTAGRTAGYVLCWTQRHSTTLSDQGQSVSQQLKLTSVLFDFILFDTTFSVKLLNIYTCFLPIFNFCIDIISKVVG